MSTPDMTWYLRTLGDHDTHWGSMDPGGTVTAECGIQFAPFGGGKLPSKPADMDQVCPNCLLPEQDAR